MMGTNLTARKTAEGNSNESDSRGTRAAGVGAAKCARVALKGKGLAQAGLVAHFSFQVEASTQS